MARLIVEEDGRRRAFKVGEGIVTLGTGSEARLKLTAPDVAEVHAEVELRGGQILLRPRPGVLPPTVGGNPVQGETAVALGQEITLGSARVWVEDENAPSAPPPRAAAPAAASPSRGVASSASDRAVRREQAIAQARSQGSRSVVQRSKPRVQRGLPGSVIAIFILVGAVVGFFVLYKVFMAGAGAEISDPRATLNAVAGHIDDGHFDLALKKLDTLPADMDAEHRARAEDLRDQIDERSSAAERSVKNLAGTQYYDTKLVKYENFYLQGKPTRAKARVFLKRCRYFKQTWPGHPKTDWVDRQERRLASVANLADPPVYEDVAWEIECLTRTNPRDYKASFGLLDAFIEDASGGELDAATELRNQMVTDREAYHLDRMQQADYEYNKQSDPGKAVLELVHLITKIGDEAKEDEAADILLKIPKVQDHLAGWKKYRPGEYEQLIRHPDVAAFVKENGI